MKDDTYNSIILLDIIRAMMNERECRTGSIFKVQMPEPDGLLGVRLHMGDHSSMHLRLRHVDLSLTSQVKD